MRLRPKVVDVFFEGPLEFHLGFGKLTLAEVSEAHHKSGVRNANLLRRLFGASPREAPATISPS